MGTEGYILWVCPSTNPLTFASTSAFQGQYHHAHLPDKETKSWTLQLASDHRASLTLTFRLFLLPREEEGRRTRGKGSEPLRAGGIQQEEGSEEWQPTTMLVQNLPKTGGPLGPLFPSRWSPRAFMNIS